MSGNPSPQHTPTDGLGVAAYVHVAGSSGSSVIESNGAAFAGQGNGASASGTHPVAQYGLVLSVSAAGGFASSVAPTLSLVDAQNNPYLPSDLDQFTAISYNNPSAGSPSWYNPSPGSSGGTTGNTTYNADIASVSVAGISGSTASATITALHPGWAVIEFAFATFDNTLGNTAQPPADQPAMKIFAQVLVQVIP
jgi:hypothetical protein